MKTLRPLCANLHVSNASIEGYFLENFEIEKGKLLQLESFGFMKTKRKIPGVKVVRI